MKSLAFLILAALPALCQSPVEPPELVAKRADHLRAIARAQLQPLATYLRSLESLKQQYVREAKSDAVVAVDAEIKTIREQLQASQAATDLTVAAPTQFQLETVMFGDPATKRMRDVTVHVRSAIDSGQPSIVLGNRELGGDPAGGVRKSVIVTYTVNGRRKQKTFQADTILDFKKDLR